MSSIVVFLKVLYALLLLVFIYHCPAVNLLLKLMHLNFVRRPNSLAN